MIDQPHYHDPPTPKLLVGAANHLFEEPPQGVQRQGKTHGGLPFDSERRFECLKGVPLIRKQFYLQVFIQVLLFPPLTGDQSSDPAAHGNARCAFCFPIASCKPRADRVYSATRALSNASRACSNNTHSAIFR